ncbi:chemotaxis protein [Bartonella schoenbuchensis]|uniref:Chemotaxis protein n=1 Tax=Bartonella schoenbuchensis m07a TaxID=1094496 RepID=N6UD36_9HYPH|nr:chemotaxis protein [Bartonella schoenbuchensis]ENN90524.1 chemotaxis protein [Bartonella schoenbuchensis m07a]
MIVKRAYGAGLLFFIIFTQGIFAQGAGGSLQKEESASYKKAEEMFVVQAAPSSKSEESSVGSEAVLSHPMQLVRSLQNLQDQIVSGQEEVLQKQPQLLREIGEKFLNFNPSVWKDEQNLYALLIYLFNGGNPSVVRVILKSYGQGVIAENIMTGVLAYLSHKQEVFFKAFANLTDEDIQSIPPALFFSIVLSTVGNTIIKDPVLAMKQLDQVRLLSPGTLFEESAIRREIKVATILGQTDLLTLLVRNYASRFGKSPYAKDFWREFGIAIPRIDEKLDDQQLEALISYAPPMVQLMAYMDVSRTALINARMERAQLSAQKALTLAHELNVNDAPARLYYAASLASSVTAHEAEQLLQNISSKDLSEKDRLLFIAAQAVAQKVTSSLVDGQKEVKTQDSTQPQSQEELDTMSKEAVSKEVEVVSKEVVEQQNAPSSTSTEINQLIEQAQEKIDEVDKLLGT